MKPSTEKMAKPARKLVQLFRRHRRKESLQGRTQRCNAVSVAAKHNLDGNMQREDVDVC